MSAIALLWLFVAVFLEVAAPVAYGSAQCPKVLYMDDVNITKMGFGPEDAKLWQEAGINGVFIEGLMPAWQIPLCTNYCADRIELIARFQKLFGEHGITDNFMYVTIPRPGEPPFHWESQNDRDQVVRNFRTGAASARKAGLKGIALDLESYTKGFWNRNDTIPNKPELIQSLGHAVGQAIKEGYPDATVVVLPEVLMYENDPSYELTPRFWQGLIETHFKELVIGTEKSYLGPHPDLLVPHVREHFGLSLQSAGVNLNSVSVALGLWPEGGEIYNQREPKETPAALYDRLRESFSANQPYVWIYWNTKRAKTWRAQTFDDRLLRYFPPIRRARQACADAVH